MDTMEIYEDCEQFSAFPEADDVFSSDFEKENLLPFGLLTIEVDGVRDEVLIAAPIADDEGRIGKHNFGEKCGGTWLTYSKRDGKWALDCSPDDLLSFHIHRLSAKKSYQEKKEFFAKSKYLESKRTSKKTKLPLFEIGGDEPNTYENWFVGVKKHIANRQVDIPGKENLAAKLFTLVGDDGKDYVRLGFVRASVYANVLMPKVHFFYQPDAKKVLLIHEFY